MLHPNVHVAHYAGGRLVETREAHNIMTEYGRAWLALLVGAAAYNADSPETPRRLAYIGFGIGSVTAAASSLSSSYATTPYPVGHDPNTTAGNEYDMAYPVVPPISTLERPVRVTGTLSPYLSASPTDAWLVQAPAVFPSHRDATSVTLNARTAAGEIAYGSFAFECHLSEAALFTSEADVNEPYNPAVAYVNFGSIRLSPLSRVEIAWTLRFS